MQIAATPYSISWALELLCCFPSLVQDQGVGQTLARETQDTLVALAAAHVQGEQVRPVVVSPSCVLCYHRLQRSLLQLSRGSYGVP